MAARTRKPAIKQALGRQAKKKSTKRPAAKKASATQTNSHFLKSFFSLRKIQLEDLPQIQLSIDDRNDLEAFLERNGYLCQCESNFFLVKSVEKSKDLWTICSYQYFALAEKANLFAKEIEPYRKFLAECDNQELETLYEAKLYLVNKIKEERKKGKKKGKGKNLKNDDEPDQIEIDLSKDNLQKLLKDPVLQTRINGINSFSSFNGDKISLFDFILNPCTKNFIQKNKSRFSARKDIVSSCVNSAFPIVVSNNGFVGDFAELIAKNDEYYKKVVEIVNRANEIDAKILEKQPLQIVFFGAPGTGKSYTIDHNLFETEKNKRIGLKDLGNPVFRTTFHPDYDYAQFVGAYKPKDEKSSAILNKNELISKLKKFKSEDISYATHKFAAFYFDSLKKLSEEESKDVFDAAEVPDSVQYTEVPKAISVAEFLSDRNNATSISYSFVPQVFAKAYAAAWRLYLKAGQRITAKDQVYLVIEEINRGNCAQIFGDIFQLLDRNNEDDKKGFSQYSIVADCDLAEWLKTREEGLKSVWNDYKNAVGEGELKFPPNLNILATMNTSDQSLFPMDSAFKRRFDWKYMPINDKEKNAHFAINLENGGEKYDWLDFLRNVNDNILGLTKSEDKQIGEFFIKPKDGTNINFEDFRSKVLFYLWDSVYKDEDGNDSEEMEKAPFFFEANIEKEDGHDKEKVNVTFQALFEETPQRQKKLVEAILNDQLKIKKWTKQPHNL